MYLSILTRCCIRKIGNIIEAIKLEKSLLAVSECNSGAFLDEMGSKTIDASLGELLAACLASMLVSVARIVELRTSLEVLENQSYVESASDLEMKRTVGTVKTPPSSLCPNIERKSKTYRSACDPSCRQYANNGETDRWTCGVRSVSPTAPVMFWMRFVPVLPLEVAHRKSHRQ